MRLKEDKYYGIVKNSFTSPAADHFFNTELLVKLLDDHRADKYDNTFGLKGQEKCYNCLYTFFKYGLLIP